MEEGRFSIQQLRRLVQFRQRRKLQLAWAALIGGVAGLFAVAFQLAIEKVHAGIWGLVNLISFGGLLPVWLILPFVVGVIGAIAGLITFLLASDASGSGVPQVKARLLHLRRLNSYRVLPAKFIAGSLAIGAGFSLGREGPSIHIGALVAGLFAKWMRIPSRARDHLIACGAGAGLAAAFNAPLAGFIFVIEELRRELSPLTYGSAFIAAVMADYIMRLALGSQPVLETSMLSIPSIESFPWMFMLGIVGGVAGVGFSRGLLSAIQRTPDYPSWQKAGVVGVAIGLLATLSYSSVVPAQDLLETLLGEGAFASFSFLILCGLLLIKCIFTILCYCTGVPGGIFAPMLLQGALLGLIVAKVAAFFGLAESIPSGVMAITTMAAYFTGVVRAPLTGVVLITEMTGNISLLFPVLVACLAAYLISEFTAGKPIYDALMEQQLRQVPAGNKLPEEPFILDLVIEPGSVMDGVYLRDLKLQPGCLCISVKSGSSEKVPGGETKLKAGDEVAVLVDPQLGDGEKILREAATTRKT
jgi:CIC family chloride channel protein